MKRQPDQVIDIPEPRGLSKRIERLWLEYSTKAQALRLTADILAEDDRRQALTAHPKKLLAAMNHRNGSRPELPPKTKAVISGPRLSLFMLDHTLEAETRTLADLREYLTAAGSPPKDGRVIAGPLGGLSRIGYIKITRDGYRRTAKGTRFRARLRAELEAKGKVIPGGYLAPS